MKENTTVTTLAEAKSLSSYNRKGMALCFEKPGEPSKKHKSHSPSDSKLTLEVDAALLELQAFSQGETINWSRMARKYSMPHKNNGGQVLKEVAKRRGIDVSRLDNRGNCTRHIQSEKKEVKFQLLCLPMTQKISEGKRESGEFLLGEPCTPYTATNQRSHP